MKRLAFFLILGLIFPLSLVAQERKKVAVVLSGGGAKGVAHIRALKVIEEAGIPVDMVVGTSMGALIGGLYCVGYSPAQIDSLVQVQDWKFLLSDGLKRKRLSFGARERTNRYILSLPFGQNPRNAFTGGLIKGVNLEQAFSHLLEGYDHPMSFDSLPIPFACVATDVAGGREIDFHQGKLYTAMRASMSIPGVFEPVRIDSMVLVDGGMLNNYPVDVARQMGADYVIGVSVQDLREDVNLNNLTNFINQISTIASAQKNEQNVANTDVFIRVNVKGYSAASFTPQAIDTLTQRGEEAARKYWDELLDLKRKLGMAEGETASRPTPRTVRPWTDSLPHHPRYAPDPLDTNSVNLGVRFDSEELAAILLNANVKLPTRLPDQVTVTLRLGQHIVGRLENSLHAKPFSRISTAYQLTYNDIDIYNKGERTFNTTYLHQSGEVGLWNGWRTVRAGIGVRYEHYHFRDFLTNVNFQLADGMENQGYFSYFADLRFDNFNRRSYPSRGMRWHVHGALYTDNFVSYKEHAPTLAVQGAWEGAFRIISSRLTLLPFVHGRALFGHTKPYTLRTFVGGQNFGKYLPQQMPFEGIGNVELGSNITAIGGFKLRQRMGGRNYLALTANYGFLLNTDDNNNTENIFGAGITYGYDSFIGPLEATLSYSNRTKEPHFYISLGFDF